MKTVITILFFGLFIPWDRSGMENHGLEICQLSRKEQKLVEGIFGKSAETDRLTGEASSPYLHPGDCIQVIKEDGDTAGFILSTSAKGRFDSFDYCILYDSSLQVKEVTVTVYRSTHGAAICRKSWLDQFTGYRGEELALGKEIDGVSGGTMSAASLVEGLRRCHQLMTGLREQGTI